LSTQPMIKRPCSSRLPRLGHSARLTASLSKVQAARNTSPTSSEVFLPALVATEFWSWYRHPGGTNRSLRIALLCRSIGTAALLLLPWIVFALCYFGDVVPNSIWAKLALYRHAGMDVTAGA
jgi:hypothetical protein